MNSRHDETMRIAESTDWSGGEVDTTVRKTSTVFSARLDPHLAEWVAAEADRRGVKPGTVIRDAVTTAAAAAQADQTVTMRLSDLHQAINTLVKSGKTRPVT